MLPVARKNGVSESRKWIWHLFKQHLTLFYTSYLGWWCDLVAGWILYERHKVDWFDVPILQTLLSCLDNWWMCEKSCRWMSSVFPHHGFFLDVLGVSQIPYFWNLQCEHDYTSWAVAAEQRGGGPSCKLVIVCRAVKRWCLWRLPVLLARGQPMAMLVKPTLLSVGVKWGVGVDLTWNASLPPS